MQFPLENTADGGDTEPDSMRAKYFVFFCQLLAKQYLIYIGRLKMKRFVHGVVDSLWRAK